MDVGWAFSVASRFPCRRCRYRDHTRTRRRFRQRQQGRGDQSAGGVVVEQVYCTSSVGWRAAPRQLAASRTASRTDEAIRRRDLRDRYAFNGHRLGLIRHAKAPLAPNLSVGRAAGLRQQRASAVRKAELRRFAHAGVASQMGAGSVLRPAACRCPTTAWMDSLFQQAHQRPGGVLGLGERLSSVLRVDPDGKIVAALGPCQADIRIQARSVQARLIRVPSRRMKKCADTLSPRMPCIRCASQSNGWERSITASPSNTPGAAKYCE